MGGRLENKVAIITGGGSGMGRSCVRLFSQEGCKVVIAEINEANGRAVEAEVKALGGDVAFFKTDMSLEEEVKACVDFTLKTYGKIDILCNNAGIGVTAHRDDFIIAVPLWEIPLDDFNRMISINLGGPYLMMRHVIPHMLEQGSGSIVNTASENAIKAVTNGDSYTAAKGGLVSLTRPLAARLGPQGIRVNCICPGGTQTPMSGEGWETIHESEEIKEITQRWPIQRMAQPEEIAYAALFLACDESSYITGVILPVDGGWYAV